MPRKTPQKSATRVPRHGRGALLTGGKPGNKGGTGRPPDEFKAMCRELASREDTRLRVATILDDPTHPMFMSALKWATEQGYGKPAQTIEMSGKGGEPLTIRVVRETKAVRA